MSLAPERDYCGLLIDHHHCSGDNQRGFTSTQDCQNVHLGQGANVSKVQEEDQIISEG